VGQDARSDGADGARLHEDVSGLQSRRTAKLKGAMLRSGPLLVAKGILIV
jgi:hypothetical protein